MGYVIPVRGFSSGGDYHNRSVEKVEEILRGIVEKTKIVACIGREFNKRCAEIELKGDKKFIEGVNRRHVHQQLQDLCNMGKSQRREFLQYLNTISLGEGSGDVLQEGF